MLSKQNRKNNDMNHSIGSLFRKWDIYRKFPLALLLLAGLLLLGGCSGETYTMLQQEYNAYLEDKNDPTAGQPSITDITVSSCADSNSDGYCGGGETATVAVTLSEPITLENGNIEITLANSGKIVITPTDVQNGIVQPDGTFLVNGTYDIQTGQTGDPTPSSPVVVTNSGLAQDAQSDLLNTNLGSSVSGESIFSGSGVTFFSFPVVTGITVNSNSSLSCGGDGSCLVGESIAVDITFSEPLTFSGTTTSIQIPLDNGGVLVITADDLASAVTNPDGSVTLTGSYPIGAGDTGTPTPSGTVTSQNGSAADSGGNVIAANLPSAVVSGGSILGSSSLTVDGNTLASIVLSAGGSGEMADGIINESEKTSTNLILGTLSIAPDDSISYAIVGTGADCDGSQTYSATANINDVTFDGDYKVCVKVTNGTATIFGESPVFNRDATVPTVILTSSTSDGTYGIGKAINITATFSEEVTLSGGLLNATLNTLSDVISLTDSGDHLHFTGTYTVGAGDSTGDLTVSTLALSAGSVRDAAGNDANLSPTSNVASTSDIIIETTPPVIDSSILASNNSYIDVTFSEGLYNTANGSGALETADFDLTFTQNGGTASNVTISSVTKTTGAALSGGESTVRVNLNITGSPDGNETVEIKPASAAIFDVAGNEASVSTTTGLKNLYVAGVASIQLGTLATTNGYIDVTFTEAAWTDSGQSGGLAAGDFNLVFTQNGGIATDVTISSVKKPDNIVEGSASATTGGESTVRLFLTVTGTPSGVETIEVKAASNAIYSSTNLATPQTSTTGVKTLYDQLAPTVILTSTTANGTYKVGSSDVNITATFSEAVTLSGGLLEASLNTVSDVISLVDSGDHIHFTGSYTIGAGDNTSDLTVSALALSAGSIRDAVGNDANLIPTSNIADSSDIRIDTAASSVAFSLPLADSRVNGSKTISFTSTEQVAPELSVDNANWIAAISGVTTFADLTGGTGFAGASEGAAFTVYLRDTDAVGNVSTTSSRAFVKDTTAPVFSSLAPATGTSVNHVRVGYNLSEQLASGTITWLGTSGPDNGVSHVQNLSGADLTMVTNPKTNWSIANPPTLVDGSTYTITFSGTDQAGNTGSSQVTGIVYDTTAPIFTSLDGANEASDGYVNASETSSAYAIAALSASGYTTADYTAILSDNPAITCDVSKIYSNSSIPAINTMTASDDVYAVCVKLTDGAGNISYGKSQQFTRDTLVPTAVTSGEPTGTSSVTTLNVDVLSTNGVTRYKYKVGLDSTMSACSSSADYSSEVAEATNITTDISGIADGTIRLCVIGKDNAGNWQAEASATVKTWTKNTGLNVSLEQSGGQADPTNAFPINFTVIFSERISTGSFVTADITQSGTAQGVSWTITNNNPGTDTNFTISATSVTAAGTIIPSIGVGLVQNYAATQTNLASTSSDNTVTYYNTVKPNVTINQAGGQNDPTNNGTIHFTVVFSKAIDPATFASGDISISGTATGTSVGMPTTSDNITWNVPVTVTGDGTVIASMNAGVVADPAPSSNTNNASTSTDNTVTYDTTAPLVTISGAPTGTNNISSLNVTISGTDVVSYQYAVGTGISCSSASYNGSDIPVATLITDTISGLADGTVTLCVRGKDIAGNLQTAAAADSVSWTKDSTSANVTLSGAPSGTSNVTSTLDITVSATSGETDYRYDIISGTDCSTATYSGSISISTHITENISGIADGTVTVCVQGYKNPTWQSTPTTASWTKDTTPPSLVTNGAETLDLDGDGKIDHIKLTFTDIVKDDTFPGYLLNSLGNAASGWAIGAYTNPRLRHGSSVSTFSGGTVTDMANDAVLYISFDENASTCSSLSQAGCDTGITPDVTYTAASFTDSLGNIIASIGTGGVAEKDSAKPVVAGASPPSNISLTLYFSETVTASTAECGSGSSQSGVDCSTIYTITGGGGLSVTKAVMYGGVGVSGNKVVLTTDTQAEGTSYTVTATTAVIKDVNNLTVNSPYNSATFTGAPPATVLISAAAIDNTTVELTFNVPVTSATAQTAGNYSISGLSVSAASMYPTPGNNSAKVRLTTSSHLSSTENGYTVTVTSGQVTAETGGNSCDSPNNEASFTGDRLPEVQSVASLDEFSVLVVYSENVSMSATGSGALNSTNYSIDGTLSVSAVTQLSNYSVRLTTSSQTLDQLYTVTVSNVVDLTGNTVSATAKTGTFLGRENLKILSGVRVTDSSSAFNVFKVTFSKPLIFGSGTVNAVDEWDSGSGALKNWSFPSGLGTVTLCTDSDDTACPASYSSGVDFVVYFKTAPEPAMGAYTVVGASTGNCILPSGGTAPTGCLKAAPDDRVSIDFGLPVVITDGPVYTDPFNDSATLSGQAFIYQGKLYIGPNNTDTGLFQTDINMQNAVNITIDADDTAGLPYESFQNYPSVLSGTVSGIDIFYPACAGVGVDPTLSGSSCTGAGGSEYLFVGAYQPAGSLASVWNSSNTISPFTFSEEGRFSTGTEARHVAAMQVFNGNIFVAFGGIHANYPRYSMLPINQSTANSTTTLIEFSYNNTRITARQDKTAKGSCNEINDTDNTTSTLEYPQFIWLDTMYTYDSDGSGVSDNRRLYLANGGCHGPDSAGTNYDRDGGIIRTQAGVTTPTEDVGGNGYTSNWEDITPNLTSPSNFWRYTNGNSSTGTRIWSKMIIPSNGDWAALTPSNTITPALLAIPKMVTFNGDLYFIRNACKTPMTDAYYHDGGLCGLNHSGQTAANADYRTNPGVYECTKTCKAGDEVPQLWRLPSYAHNSNVIPTSSNWQFIGNLTTGKTNMSGAYWADGVVQDQTTKAASNTEITLLVATGDRLYIGFDNGVYGANLWRTKDITQLANYSTLGSNAYPASESDFEAVCATGNSCYDPALQFGFGQTPEYPTDDTGTPANSRFFDSLSVNDSGTDYIIFNVGDGYNPMKIYRMTNN